jgi:hypothetical protein
MQTIELIKHYEKLPETYKQEVSDFIEFLLSKTSYNNSIIKSRGGLGMSKGQFNMSKDFDEPLIEFKEYIK